MSEVIISPANQTQAAEICTVLRRSIQDVCGPDYENDPQTLNDWIANKTPENVAEWIAADDSYSIVAEHEAEVVGFALASGDEILLNYVVPEYLGRGAGHLMLTAIEAWAEERGVTTLKCSSTITAREFYQRHGFWPSGQPQYVGSLLGEFPLSKVLGT